MRCLDVGRLWAAAVSARFKGGELSTLGTEPILQNWSFVKGDKSLKRTLPMAEEDTVAEGTRGLVRGALIVAVILIIIFAALFVFSRSRGGEGKPAASLDVHSRQIT